MATGAAAQELDTLFTQFDVVYDGNSLSKHGLLDILDRDANRGRNGDVGMRTPADNEDDEHEELTSTPGMLRPVKPPWGFL